MILSWFYLNASFSCIMGVEDRKCKIGDKGLSDNSGLPIFFPQSVKHQRKEKGRWKQAPRHKESACSLLAGIQSWRKNCCCLQLWASFQDSASEFPPLPHSDAQVCQDQAIAGLWVFVCRQCELCTPADLCAKDRDITQGRKSILRVSTGDISPN